MPRRARHYLSGLPYHVVQRGNNREACFIEPENYQRYLALWQDLSDRYGVRVHAYCLMTNHVHFLATPDRSDSISNTFRAVGSRYAQYINRKYRRSGTLWEGRHKASLIQSETYLLTCYRYIELNPVRAGMLQRPDQYAWSSYRENSRGEFGWLVPHPEYMRLGADVAGRTHAYTELFKHQFYQEDLIQIRKAAHYSHPLGDDRFCRQVEKKYGIKLGHMKRGRPKKTADVNSG